MPKKFWLDDLLSSFILIYSWLCFTFQHYLKQYLVHNFSRHPRVCSPRDHHISIWLRCTGHWSTGTDPLSSLFHNTSGTKETTQTHNQEFNTNIGKYAEPIILHVMKYTVIKGLWYEMYLWLWFKKGGLHPLNSRETSEVLYWQERRRGKKRKKKKGTENQESTIQRASDTQQTVYIVPSKKSLKPNHCCV